MIIGEQREAVIANIAAAAEAEDFHRKVELNDPVLTAQQGRSIADNYLKNRGTAAYKCKQLAARTIANIGTDLINRDTEIVGIEKLEGLTGGAILTCNHFSPLDNTVVRHLTRRLGKKRINIVSQLSNFAMPGMIGFLMNYADTIPLGTTPQYMLRQLPQLIRELTDRGEFVLIYPEEEMWFNYRKPRPGLRGAFYYAAKLDLPVISCFIEMQDRQEMDTDTFRKVRYRLHILDVIRPEARENGELLKEKDYALKKAAYERIYGKALTYTFAPADIAGWTGELDQ